MSALQIVVVKRIHPEANSLCQNLTPQSICPLRVICWWGFLLPKGCGFCEVSI